MKKALALFMALVMICSVVATLSTVSATDAKAAPVLDGVISDGEYTYSVTTNVSDLSAGAKTEVEGTEVVEYFAYNATYLYYGIVFTQTADNRACWPQMKVNNTFNVYSNETGTVNYYHSRAALQARYLADGTTINNGITAPAGGTTPTFEKDMYVTATKDANNVKTYEFKFARAYFAANAGCEAADVRVVPMWTWFHDQTSTAHVLTAEDMLNLEDAGVGTINDFGQGGTMYNFVVLDSEAKDETYENLANKLGLVYYVGEPVAEEPVEEPDPYAEINLEKLYGATYVGEALTEEDAKPVLDGVINEGEYQAEYVITADGKDAIRFGAQALLLADYKQYVSHDDEYIYAAFDFYNANTGLRGRFYWNLSFIDSFDVQYYGGNNVNSAFKQNDHGLAEGWNFGGEIKANIEEGYSDRGNAVSFGTAPVKGTDYDVAVGKEDLAEPIDAEGNSTTHQIYEFKISKAWYAAQVGLESAADVRELAWVALAQEANLYGSSYTQFGHYISDADLATLNATGFTYTRPSVSSHPYDNASLPFLFVLDKAPIDIKDLYDENGYRSTYVGKALSEEAAKPVQDGVISENEYQAMYFVSKDGSKDVMRRGAKTDLRNDYKEYIAHDAEWIYFAAEFDNVTTDTRGRFYWNLFFLDNFKYEYNGGSTANGAFVQNGKGIKNGWLYGGEIKANIAEGYSERSNSVTSGTAPVVGTDVYVGVGKQDLGESEWAGWYNGHQVYEFKVSKAWYAAQAGLAGAEDVVNLAWITMGQQINGGGSAYTQIGHVINEDVYAALAANGAEYKANGTNWDLDDDKVLPRLFILDDAPEGYYEVDTQVAASVRLSTTNPGLRFKTNVSKAFIDELVATYGENVKVGTLIAPADLLDGKALTIDTATKIDVVASIANPFAQTEDTYTFAGSITKIKPQNLTRDFTAVGYVAYSADGENWTYIYSVSTATRNVTEIAQAAVDAGEFAEDADALEILQNLGAVAAE